MPGLNFEQLKEEKDEIYLDKRSRKEADYRLKIIEEYSVVEKNIEDFRKKKISSHQFANALGRVEMGLNDEHPSAQIYAFEQLLKSLSETENKDDIKEIVNEIVCDMSFEMDRIKSEYLLGIAAFYTGQYQMKGLERKKQAEKREDAWSDDRVKIIKNFYSALNKDNKDLEDYKKNLPGVKGVVNFIKADFPEKTESGQVARLVGKYYEMNMRDIKLTKEEKLDVEREVRQRTAIGEDEDTARQDILERLRVMKKYPTIYPFLPEETVDDDNDDNISRPNSGRPQTIVKLPYGHHISLEKVAEADWYSFPLSVEIVKDTRKGDAIKRVRVRISKPNNLIDDYIRKVRNYKEQIKEDKKRGPKNRKKKWLKPITREEIEEAYVKVRKEIWNNMDDATKHALGGVEEMTQLHCNSIRDEELDDRGISDFKAEWGEEDANKIDFRETHM